VRSFLRAETIHPAGQMQSEVVACAETTHPTGRVKREVARLEGAIAACADRAPGLG
jgi:hypothetical protein